MEKKNYLEILKIKRLVLIVIIIVILLITSNISKVVYKVNKNREKLMIQQSQINSIENEINSCGDVSTKLLKIFPNKTECSGNDQNSQFQILENKYIFRTNVIDGGTGFMSGETISGDLDGSEIKYQVLNTLIVSTISDDKDKALESDSETFRQYLNESQNIPKQITIIYCENSDLTNKGYWKGEYSPQGFWCVETDLIPDPPTNANYLVGVEEGVLGNDSLYLLKGSVTDKTASINMLNVTDSKHNNAKLQVLVSESLVQENKVLVDPSTSLSVGLKLKIEPFKANEEITITAVLVDQGLSDIILEEVNYFYFDPQNPTGKWVSFIYNMDNGKFISTNGNNEGFSRDDIHKEFDCVSVYFANLSGESINDVNLMPSNIDGDISGDVFKPQTDQSGLVICLRSYWWKEGNQSSLVCLYEPNNISYDVSETNRLSNDGVVVALLAISFNPVESQIGFDVNGGGYFSIVDPLINKSVQTNKIFTVAPQIPYQSNPQPGTGNGESILNSWVGIFPKPSQTTGPCEFAVPNVTPFELKTQFLSIPGGPNGGCLSLGGGTFPTSIDGSNLLTSTLGPITLRNFQGSYVQIGESARGQGNFVVSTGSCINSWIGNSSFFQQGSCLDSVNCLENSLGYNNCQINSRQIDINNIYLINLSKKAKDLIQDGNTLNFTLDSFPHNDEVNDGSTIAPVTSIFQCTVTMDTGGNLTFSDINQSTPQLLKGLKYSFYSTGTFQSAVLGKDDFRIRVSIIEPLINAIQIIQPDIFLSKDQVSCFNPVPMNLITYDATKTQLQKPNIKPIDKVLGFLACPTNNGQEYATSVEFNNPGKGYPNIDEIIKFYELDKKNNYKKNNLNVQFQDPYTGNFANTITKGLANLSVDIEYDSTENKIIVNKKNVESDLLLEESDNIATNFKYAYNNFDSNLEHLFPAKWRWCYQNAIARIIPENIDDKQLMNIDNNEKFLYIQLQVDGEGQIVQSGSSPSKGKLRFKTFKKTNVQPIFSGTTLCGLSGSGSDFKIIADTRINGPGNNFFTRSDQSKIDSSGPFTNVPCLFMNSAGFSPDLPINYPMGIAPGVGFSIENVIKNKDGYEFNYNLSVTCPSTGDATPGLSSFQWAQVYSPNLLPGLNTN